MTAVCGCCMGAAACVDGGGADGCCCMVVGGGAVGAVGWGALGVVCHDGAGG